MEIFAIGHSNYPYDKLINMIKKYDINCVVDIRETPYSKYNIQYNKEAFNESLRNSGFIYIYMGKEFGAKRNNKDVYTQEGYADFEKVAKEDIFLNGIERLKKGCQMGYRIVLLGAMQEPIRCHRSILVGKVLNKEGFDVKYIMHEGNLTYQEDIEESLLDKYFSDREQLSIDNLLGSALTREEMIQEGYKLANKEIGYRTEKLGK
ncbi:TPA: DUF488 domain-containing protein [Clostridioides difficile]|uniref:DUF488 domain-containing protein n=1 Tax=Clostridioides difficile TaxID=1496 RepID=UPI00038D71D0|nr:DUF488 domain-containing protein [Clostridioides difficile]EGT5081794.1 DUF488 domain-containing protein [Clostridioides difficile]EGT5137758.1 DUF488 domain-containing protein [Clostridioides difficile]EGT5284944.1 DUF488 domain-containing protein [Clostridioides difficile]EQK01230.1 hypothetical protein QUI_3642 [Clostridioides difficile P59]MBG0194624.1 DUF488 domain-containing protein [Clostridioides difficile]